MAQIELPNGETLAAEEVESLHLAFEGHPAQESAHLLFVSVRTVHARLPLA